MLLDALTINNLELITNLSCSKANHETLMGIMDHTLTPMGKRFLRLNICQPLYDKVSLQLRLNCIEELMESNTKIGLIRDCLIKINDLDSIIKRILMPTTFPTLQYYETNLRIIIDFNSLLISCQNLGLILPNYKSELIKMIFKVNYGNCLIFD